MKTVLEYLENSNKNNSEKIAVIDENGEYTYNELEEISKKIGTGLSKKIDQHKPVPILMEKGRDTLVTFFGSLYAGGFYVLLNPDLPRERLKNILNTLEVNYLVTGNEYLQLAKELVEEENVFRIEDLKETKIDEEKLKQIRESALSIDPVYANFTSGSTGIPKGVLVSHNSVIDFIDNFTHVFNIKNDDKCMIKR